MQFIDLKSQYQKIANQVQHNINQVLDHGKFILGPEVKELEERLRDYVTAKHCISVANGTDALMIALMALNIKPEDEVITTPFSFFGTVEVILLLGAKAVFVDIDPKTYNLDANRLEAAITPRTKAILPVNLYGQCADFTTICAIAKKHNIPIIEDAAQSFGATHHGKLSCSLGTIACTSFFPSKPLGCYGDGGACFTDDDKLAKAMREIRDHGQANRYNHVRLGLNSRLDTLQAAILLAKLAIFPEELQRRQQVAKSYDQYLKDHIEVPFIAPHNQSAYAQYTIRIPKRNEVSKYLSEQGIPTAIHYPIPLHKQPICLNLQDSADLTQAELAANMVLSLPFHPYLEENTIAHVANNIIRALEL